MKTAVGIDVGGTKIAAGRVTADGKLSDWTVVSSRAAEPDETADAIVSIAKSLWDGDCAGVGVGAAGLVDHDAGVIRYAPNLRYRELPLRDLLWSALGPDVAVSVDNDANVAAWGELRCGAARGSRHLVMVTVGTGIGGGIVIDGRLLRGSRGMAAEVGHMVIDPAGPFCGCGQKGCWERLASGTALGRMAQDAVTGVPGSTILALAGGDVHAVTGQHVTEAAAQGDELASELIRRLGQNLGAGLVNLANVFDPDVIVIGGGLVSVGEALLGPAREALARRLEGADHRPGVPVLAAELGEAAGVVGAGLVALDGI